MPRFLLRLPYGKDAAPTEIFQFEEMPVPPKHDLYLWGNPGFAGALLMARGFLRRITGKGYSASTEIDDLPAHADKESGENGIPQSSQV